MKRKRLLIFSVMAGMIIASHAAADAFYQNEAATVAPPVSLEQLKGEEIYNSQKSNMLVNKFFIEITFDFFKIVIKGMKDPDRSFNLNRISSYFEKNSLFLLDYCDQEQEFFLSSTATQNEQTVVETFSLYCLTDQGTSLVAKIDDLNIDWKNLLKRGLTGTLLGLPEHSSRLDRSLRYPEIVFFGGKNGKLDLFSEKNKLKRLSFLENYPLVVDPFGLVLLIKTMKIEQNNLSHKIHLVINRKVKPMWLDIKLLEKESSTAYHPFVITVFDKKQKLVEVKVDGNEGRNLSHIKFLTYSF